MHARGWRETQRRKKRARLISHTHTSSFAPSLLFSLHAALHCKKVPGLQEELERLREANVALEAEVAALKQEVAVLFTPHPR